MKLKNKKVFVTGASGGIGKACAEQFAAEGADLLLCARRLNVLENVAQSIRQKYGVEVFTFALDVTDREAVKTALTTLPVEWQAIDVLVNNAGLALGLEKIYEANIDDWERMIDTNIKGLLYISHHVLGWMVKRNAGHIVNLGSISSHEVYSGGVVYCATKHAERAISQGLKMDVHGTPIRVSSVDPGMADTDFSRTRFAGNEQKAADVYKGMTPLNANDIADAILYCVTRPSHVNVREIKIYPTAQTAGHLCHRES